MPCAHIQMFSWSVYILVNSIRLLLKINIGDQLAFFQETGEYFDGMMEPIIKNMIFNISAETDKYVLQTTNSWNNRKVNFRYAEINTAFQCSV